MGIGWTSGLVSVLSDIWLRLISTTHSLSASYAYENLLFLSEPNIANIQRVQNLILKTCEVVPYCSQWKRQAVVLYRSWLLFNQLFITWQLVETSRRAIKIKLYLHSSMTPHYLDQVAAKRGGSIVTCLLFVTTIT